MTGEAALETDLIIHYQKIRLNVTLVAWEWENQGQTLLSEVRGNMKFHPPLWSAQSCTALGELQDPKANLLLFFLSHFLSKESIHLNTFKTYCSCTMLANIILMSYTSKAHRSLCCAHTSPTASPPWWIIPVHLQKQAADSTWLKVEVFKQNSWKAQQYNQAGFLFVCFKMKCALGVLKSSGRPAKESMC